MKTVMLTAVVLLVGISGPPALAATRDLTARSANLETSVPVRQGTKRLGLRKAERYRVAARESHSAATSGVALLFARSTMKLA